MKARRGQITSLHMPDSQETCACPEWHNIALKVIARCWDLPMRSRRFRSAWGGSCNLPWRHRRHTHVAPEWQGPARSQPEIACCESRRPCPRHFLRDLCCLLNPAQLFLSSQPIRPLVLMSVMRNLMPFGNPGK